MDREPAPWWVSPARHLIRALPAGRFRAAALAARANPAPFVARMSPAHGGARFWCDLHDAIACDVCLIGAYERQVSEVIARLARASSCCIDVGANWGYFTLMAAGLMGPGGRTLALEPDPRMSDLLHRNLELNGFDRVEALPIAAGAEEAVRTLDGFEADAGNRGESRIRTDRSAPCRGTSFAVRTVPIDALLDERRIAAVDLIKIDVEGFEAEVLRGMATGLAGRRYRHVVIELHPALLAARGMTADDCCEPLRRSGYAGWAFDHSPAAVRQAAYARALPIASLLTRTDRVPPADPWPHMLWTADDEGVAVHG